MLKKREYHFGQKGTYTPMQVNGNNKGEFKKKGRGRIYFVCEDGEIMGNAAKETRETGEPRTVTTTSIGRDSQGREIARFLITWSFKAKPQKQLVRKWIKLKSHVF